MIKVFVAQHLVEARQVRAMLEAEGIPAEIRGEQLFGVLDAAARVIPGLLPSVWIQDDGQLYQAKALVNRFLHPADST